MRKIILLIFILFLFSFTNAATTTGDVTKVDFSLSVSVSETIPILHIISPENGTYLTNQLDLIFTSKNTNKILFNLDDIINVSINESTTFFATTGNHTLNVYALKDNKTIHHSIDLIINPDLFQIIYTNYKNYSKTTNFYRIIYEKYVNLENIILANNFGEIHFKESINIPTDKNITDKTVNLNKYSYIKQNEIFLDSIELPNFNKETILYLYNLSFKNPVILKNNQICQNNECEHISYINKTLIFKINGFSTYRAIEAEIYELPPLLPSASTGIPFKDIDFTLSETEIKINSKQGRIIKKNITITNNLNSKIKIKIIPIGIKDITLINNTEITFLPKEQKNITIEFLIRHYLKPGTQIGKIQINSEEQNETILVIINIESLDALFDIKTKIDSRTKRIFPWLNIITHTSLYNLGEDENINATIIYEIKNIQNKKIKTYREDIILYKEYTIKKDLSLPKKTPPGDYILTTALNYNNKTAISTDNFQIINTINCYYIIILMLILIILFILKKRYHNSKKSKSRGI